ncbi:MAG: Translation initiation factor IF-2 [Chlamydiae bacterium]|nr:Translation initiation factor IF-2 [Chlamydiota bacterium]
MAKEIKLSIKNKQLADGLNLNKLKNKLIKKQDKETVEPPAKKVAKKATTKPKTDEKKPVVKKVAKAASAPKTQSTPKTHTIKEKSKTPPPLKTEEPKVKAEKKPVTTGRTPPPLRKPISKEDIKHELRVDRPIKIKRFAKGSEEETKKVETPKTTKAPEKKFEKKAAEPKKSSLKQTKGFKDYKDLPTAKKSKNMPAFDSRNRHGLTAPDEGTWQRRRRRPRTKKSYEEDTTIRPSELKIRIPITIKNLAVAMKIKSSQLISVLFKQGLTLTLNDILEDETTIQLLGQEFSCDIQIDTAEQDRIQITDKLLEEEIKETDESKLAIRPPVVTFMGHVDHGKTSLIDAIRKSNRVASEAGDITQHIGAFQCTTSHGPITVLDTPGHEAFSAMRSRGANVTDIVVLVVAGDEGIKDQTIEALKQAKEAAVTLIVAINKSDKENFDTDPIYRGLSDHELIPEQWGGTTIMVNCSAKTGDGIPELLELIALQSEILELKANSDFRARGTVLESEVHKGMGNVATLLVQNGTLNVGDAVVFDHHYARIKTLINDVGQRIQHAGPSTPVEITGMSGLPEAGHEFIVVPTEKEAKQISEMRILEFKAGISDHRRAKQKDNFLENSDQIERKILTLILRADVQGSLEALKHSLSKIETQKVDLNIISCSVGEVTESDIQLAKTSGACIIGFHTRIESHAEELMKNMNVLIKMPKIIYEAVDIIKELMVKTLDKVEKETDKSKLEVKAVFKASRVGKIAGCSVQSGLITRNHKARVIRDGTMVWKGNISSLKREKEDVREVKKGMECGVVLEKYTDIEVGDIIESFEVTYHEQTL